MKRLLKKEIGTVSTTVLNMRYCRILERGETMDAKDIPVADAREILWIEDELRKRVIKGVGHDFYPPDHIEEYPKATPKFMPNPPPQNNTIKEILKPTKEMVKPGVKIKFNIVVTSSIGSKAANFRVEADSKDEADIMARKMIRKLGLQGATHKIN